MFSNLENIIYDTNYTALAVGGGFVVFQEKTPSSQKEKKAGFLSALFSPSQKT